MKFTNKKFLVSRIIMGFILLVVYCFTLPDGKLHITFCDVGQGDATYIQFPNGRDMVIDGGPDGSILSCLGAVMPFWDRSIDLVLLTHPEKDHFGGLTEIVKRYRVGALFRSDSANSSVEYNAFVTALSDRHVSVKYIVARDQIAVGSVFSFVFVAGEQFISERTRRLAAVSNILGAQTEGLNSTCLVFYLKYGKFTGFFPGDADTMVEPYYIGSPLPSDQFTVLKVPHHGSAGGMSKEFLDWLRPALAVISVGKHNLYGHPTPKALSLLSDIGARIFRTDQNGTVQLVSDGKTWSIKTEKK